MMALDPEGTQAHREDPRVPGTALSRAPHAPEPSPLESSVSVRGLSTPGGGHLRIWVGAGEKNTSSVKFLLGREAGRGLGWHAPSRPLLFGF